MPVFKSAKQCILPLFENKEYRKDNKGKANEVIPTKFFF